MDWGDIEMRWSRGKRHFSDDEQDILLSLLPCGQVMQDFVEQAGVYHTMPKQRLTLAMNYLDSVLAYQAEASDVFYDGKNSFIQWMFVFGYEGQSLEIASEVFTQKVLVNNFVLVLERVFEEFLTTVSNGVSPNATHTKIAYFQKRIRSLL